MSEQNTHPLDDFERFQGRPRCCDEDFGGSHYHCAKCGKVSSMLGHRVGPVTNARMAKMFGVPVGFDGFLCEFRAASGSGGEGVTDE